VGDGPARGVAYEADDRAPMNLNPTTNYRARVGIGLFVVLLVVVAGGAFTYTVTADQVRDQQRSTLQGQANSHEDLVGAHVAEYREETASVATDLEGANADARERILSEDAQASDRTTRLLVADVDSGTVQASSDGAYVGQSLADNGFDVPDDALSAGESAATFRNDPTDPTWVFYAPVGDGTVVVRQVAVVDLVGDLSPIVEGSNTRVVNADGVVMLDATATGAIGEQHVDGDGVQSPAVRAALDGQMGASGVADVAAGQSGSGERAVVGYQQLSSTGWAVVSYASPGTVYAVAVSVGNNILLLVGAVALVLGGFVVLVERPTVRALDELAAVARRFERGDLEEGVDSDREDQIGAAFTALDAMRASLGERIAEAETARSEAEAAREETAALNEQLEAKAAEYEATLSAVADGDLTVRVDPESDHDVIASLGEHVNRTLDALAATLTAVNDAAATVEQSSEDVSVGAEQLGRANEDINESVQEISAGAERQNESLREVATEMNDMSASVEEIASTADEVASVVEDAADRGEAGRAAAGDAIEEMRRIEETTGSTVAEIETLAAEMDRIGEMAELIDDIAEQTNVLALNASIEAARAGEAGEGFAVVADEIKELAEQTGEATGEIEALVEELQDATATAVEDMRTTQRRVDEGTGTVEDALAALEAVVDRVEDSLSGVESIDVATEDQAASTNEVVTMVDDVTSVSERNSGRADAVAASVEEQTAATAELSETAENLASVATSLNDQLAAFDLGAGAGGDAPADAGGGVPGTDGEGDGDAGPLARDDDADDGGDADDDGDAGDADGDAGAPDGAEPAGTFEDD
jgi:methyl-accepting chemotaxis protein